MFCHKRDRPTKASRAPSLSVCLSVTRNKGILYVATSPSLSHSDSLLRYDCFLLTSQLAPVFLPVQGSSFASMFSIRTSRGISLNIVVRSYVKVIEQSWLVSLVCY
jgi:hypothetical protein